MTDFTYTDFSGIDMTAVQDNITIGAIQAITIKSNDKIWGQLIILAPYVEHEDYCPQLDKFKQPFNVEFYTCNEEGHKAKATLIDVLITEDIRTGEILNYVAKEYIPWKKI